MGSLVLEPAPYKNEIGKPGSGAMSGPWQDFFQLVLLPRLQNAAPNLVTVPLTAQSASIGATNLIPLAVGLFRISWYSRITTAASISSSLQVTVQTSDVGVAIAQSGAAVTTNTTASIQSGSVLMACSAADGSGTPLQFLVTYASAGTAMKFKLTVTTEQLA